MPIASRYLATVRRATSMPSLASRSTSRESERGLRAGSSAISLRMRARMAVLEWASPLPLPPTWLEKKNLSSKTPRGVWMYFWVVTREMVDSCISTTSAMLARISGFMPSSPCSRKSIWRAMISRPTLSRVSLRDDRLFISQRASCRLSLRKVLSADLSARLISAAYSGWMRSLGSASGLSSTCQPWRVWRTSRSGIT